MPDQKVIATGIICLAVIFGIVIYHERDSIFGTGQAQAASTASVTVETGTSTVATTDDDWKNLLNITTASDTAVQILTTDASQNSNDDNITAQLSKNFFALYLQDQKNGVTIDQNEADTIANEAISGISVPVPINKYGTKDIHITTNTSLVSRTNYENAIIQSVQNSGLNSSENEMNIVSQATQSENQNDLNQLDPIIAGYRKLIKSTLQITVPQNATGIHLVYLNTLNNLMQDIQGLEQTLNDPVAGYVAFTSYQKDSTELTLIIQKMDLYFQSQQ